MLVGTIMWIEDILHRLTCLIPENYWSRHSVSIRALSEVTTSIISVNYSGLFGQDSFGTSVLTACKAWWYGCCRKASSTWGTKDLRKEHLVFARG